MASLFRNRRAWISAVSILALLLASGTLAVWWWKSLSYVSTEDARVKAEIVSVSPEIAGTIVAIAKGEGENVSVGDLMAKLDDRELKIQLKQIQANLDRARSYRLQIKREIALYQEKHRQEMTQARAVLRGHQHALEDALAHLDMAREDWQRSKALFEKELVAAQSQAHAETEFRQAQARVASLREKIREAESLLELARVRGKEVAVKKAELQAREADLRQTEAVLAELRHKIELTTLRSPTEGVVVKKNARHGEYVQPGQTIFMVVDTTRFWMEANVEETQIRHIALGNAAVIKVDSYPRREFTGRVYEIGGATVSEFSLFSPQKLTGQFIKSTQRLPVKISVQNPDGLLKVGMQAVVWIEKRGKRIGSR